MHMYSFLWIQLEPQREVKKVNSIGMWGTKGKSCGSRLIYPSHSSYHEDRSSHLPKLQFPCPIHRDPSSYMFYFIWCCDNIVNYYIIYKKVLCKSPAPLSTRKGLLLQG